MLVELNYIFFSLLLVIYSAWRYFRQRERHMLHLTICFTLLTFSITLQILTSTWWTYIMHLKIPLRLLELSGLALYTGFTISTILTLRKISAKTPKF